MTARRYRLRVEPPGSEDIDGFGDAVIECTMCGDPILLSEDAQAADFSAAELDAAECGCNAEDGQVDGG